MKDETIKCDRCLKDITSTKNCIDYRLHLNSQKKTIPRGAATLMYISDPLENEAHFCDMYCLKQWCTEK